MHTLISVLLAQTSPPPSPGLPPLFPNFRYGNLYYAIVQEIRTFDVSQANADIRTFGKDDIMTKLEAFEAELVSERKLAMQRVCNEIAEEDGGAG